MMRYVVENIATMVCTTALVLGLYAMGAGGYCLFGFVLLLNMNGNPKPAKP